MDVDYPKSTLNPISTAIIVTAGTLLLVSLCVYTLGSYNLKLNRQGIYEKIETLALAAAHLIDGDKHQQLVVSGEQNSSLYTNLLAPLVALHNDIPDMYYLYTMILKGDNLYFVLDTATSNKLISKRQLEASLLMDPYEISGSEANDWMHSIRIGESYVDHELYTDEFGTFISGTAPFYNSAGEYVGVVGIDFDPIYFLASEKKIKRQITIAMALAFLLSLVAGLFTWLNQQSLKKLRDAQYLLAITDPLTNAFNRRYAVDRGKEEYARYQRYNAVYSVLAIDIDHFKQINDAFGHASGDAILISLVREMKNHLRTNDILIRMGGEEFIILLPHTASGGAKILAERIRVFITEKKFEVSTGDLIKITISIGIACAIESDKDTESIIARADKALYQAKHEGRNCTCFL